MSTHPGKAASERNQKMLLELVSQPGNNICADCKARTPRWASSNLGIFICVNCASIHRKIGTHVTKVKSLTMDDWTKEQVDHMRSLGNAKSNSIYNPNELRHPPPPNLEDADRDSEIEQYIRAKYQYKKFLDKSALVASKLGPSRSAASVAPRTVSQPVASASSSAPKPAPPQPSSSAAPSSTIPASKSTPFPTQYPSSATQLQNPIRSASQPIPPQQLGARQPTGGVWDDLSSLSTNAPSQNSSLPLQYQSPGINPYAQQNPGFNPFAQQQQQQQQQFLGGASPAAQFYQPQPLQQNSLQQPTDGSFLSPSPSLLGAPTGGSFLSASPSQPQQFLSPSPSQPFLSPSPSQQQFLSPSPSGQFMPASPSQQFTGMSGGMGMSGASMGAQPTGQFLGMTSMQMQQQLMLQQQAEQQRQAAQQQAQQQQQLQQQLAQQQAQQLAQQQAQQLVQQQAQQAQLQQQIAQQQMQQQLAQQQQMQQIQQMQQQQQLQQHQQQQAMFQQQQMFGGGMYSGGGGQWGAM